jgi:Icc-related predicted phosphoesterase
MYTGYVDEWYSRLDSLCALSHEVKLLVPGNHDYHISNYEAIAVSELKRSAGVTTLMPDKPKYTLPNGMTVLGIPFVTDLPGWAFNVQEMWLETWLLATDMRPDIVISHSPVRGVLDAIHPDRNGRKHQKHVGSRALKEWFESVDTPPKVWIHGHIHESYGDDIVNGCHFYNVANCDREYGQTNPARIIDL